MNLFTVFDPAIAKEYYQSLAQPTWAPPEWLFGVVWPILYVIIIVSFGYIFWQALRGKLPNHVWMPFAINLILNILWQPLQLTVRSLWLDVFMILAVLFTLVWAMRQVWNRPGYQWVGYANVPYLLWVTFASALQIAILVLNM